MEQTTISQPTTSINRDLASDLMEDDDLNLQSLSESEASDIEAQPSKVPRGRAKSGRIWKHVVTSNERRNLRCDPRCRPSLSKKRHLDHLHATAQEASQQIREERKQRKEEKRKRSEENKKRREENERRAQITVPIRDTRKLKRMKRKQLRTIVKV